uniref:Glutamate decarboxylase n=1 Tax=Oryza punctata TaxID=4537 RepID=A0A0E0LVQ3_ORYPU
MVVSVAATGSDTAEPVQYSTFFASRYVRDPLPRGSAASKPAGAMVLSHASSSRDDAVRCTFATRYACETLPRFRMPEQSIPREAAYQIINDELMLDGNPRLNLASFVTTWMEPECDKLIMDSVNKNYVDMDEYPVTTELQNRCVNMIAHLFNAPIKEDETAIGVGTVGSSEAIMLAGLAFKRKWQNKRKEQGKPCDKPNIVTGANVQVCWEKFARYFEVELKEVKLSEGYYVMDPVKAVEMVDENTICVAAILGSTLTGEFEDVKLLNNLLTEKNKETGWDVPIHVDAASGGFIAPFLYPELEWDFRLPLVKSINVSGHKYGLVYPGVGWGYKNIMQNCMENTAILREGIEATGRFEILSKEAGVPLVAFSLKDSGRYTVFDISENLRRFGWIVPAYTMPANAEHVAVLRVVIREDFSRSLAERLVSDIVKILHELDAHSAQVLKISSAVAKQQSGDDGVVSKKSVLETEREIFAYWRDQVKKKQTGVC